MKTMTRFPKRVRLLKAEEFKQVFRKAYRSKDNYFTVLAHEKKVGDAKLGLAISKKVIRKAVSRNRLKRIIRESFRQSQSEIGRADYVVMAQGLSDKTANQELFRSLANHWDNLTKKCAE